jgi:trigger factor
LAADELAIDGACSICDCGQEWPAHRNTAIQFFLRASLREGVSVSDATSTGVMEEQDGVAAPEKYKLSLDVQLQNIGPCRRHVKVTIPEKDIQHYRTESIKELSKTVAVPGFRVGKVPAALLERRFRKELQDQIRQQVLLQSLEQLADDEAIDPIDEPRFDLESMEIPDTGEFTYEFDVEVRPTFDLPNYSGIKIRRPVKETTDADVAAYLDRFVAQYATYESKEGTVAAGDRIEGDIEFHHGDRLVRKLEHQHIDVKPTVRFWDGEIHGFVELVSGAAVGEQRTGEVTIAQEAEAVEMRGEKVKVTINIHQIQSAKMPERNSEFAARLGMETMDDLEQEVRRMLVRQVEYRQRQETRQQVIDAITESATWELPEELVSKQVENALRREILEMQQAGFTTAEVQARESQIRQKSVSTTRSALKQHFVLDRIATEEKIEVEPKDIESEIQLMALQRGENPRRLRSRLEKSGMIENLDAQIRERKAVDFILSKAQFEDYPLETPESENVFTISAAICGNIAVTTQSKPEDEEPVEA